MTGFFCLHIDSSTHNLCTRNLYLLPGYFVYVLYSIKDERLYIGYTSNLNKRIHQHNEGMSISTRNRRPLMLIFYEAYLFKHDALRREKYFKTSKGKRALKLMLTKTLLKVKSNI